MIDKLLIVIAILGFGWISCESVSKAVLMPNVSPKNVNNILLIVTFIQTFVPDFLSGSGYPIFSNNPI